MRNIVFLCCYCRDGGIYWSIIQSVSIFQLDLVLCFLFLPIERYEIFDRRVFAVSDIQLLFWSGARNINKGNFLSQFIFFVAAAFFPISNHMAFFWYVLKMWLVPLFSD